MEQIEKPLVEKEKEAFVFQHSFLEEPQAESPDRQNEDAHVILEDEEVLVAGIFDGATKLSSVTGVTVAGEQGGRFAAQASVAGIEKEYIKTSTARGLLIDANQEIANRLLLQGIESEKKEATELSNTQAVAVRIDKVNGVIDVSAVGDVACLVKYRSGKIELVTPLDITLEDDQALIVAQELVQNEGITFTEAIKRPEVNNILFAGRARCNAPDGQGVGVLDGRKSAEKYMHTRQLAVSEVEELILLTDGMFLPTTVVGAEPDWRQMVDIIDQTGLDGLRGKILEMKNSDPDFTKYPRFKKHDDTTGVIIKIKGEDEIKQATYFDDLVQKHLPEIRLLMRGGKLWQKDDWRNVVEHCVAQAATAEVTARLLQLSPQDSDTLIRVAFCHDWRKRLDRRPGQFTDREKVHAQQFFDRVNPDQKLIDATGPEFLEKALVRGEATFLEKLQFYIDDITMGSELVPFRERIDEVRARRQDLDDDPAMTARLGGKYWDREIELGEQVEKEIFEVLQGYGEQINSPQELPIYLKEKIKKEIEKVNLKKDSETR